MNSSKYFSFALVSVIFFMVSCKDDDDALISKTCIISLLPSIPQPCDTIPLEPNGGFKNQEPNRNFGFPCFSPHNTCEFIAIKGDAEKQISELVRYDLNTNTEDVIIQFSIISQPKWNIKDWVVFHSNDGQIWKVKIEGDSLTRLTHSGVNSFPDWSPDGEKIVFKRGNKHAIMDKNGILITELDSLLGAVYWSPNGLDLAFVGNDNISFFSLSNQKTESIIPFQDYVNDAQKWIKPNTLSWLFDGESILWTNHAGSLYSTDVINNVTKLVAEGCDPRGDKFYSTSSASIGNDKIIATRHNRSFIAPDTLYLEGVLTLFDVMENKEFTIRPKQ